MSASETLSGKGHHDENFPVASRLIAAQYRPAILAFYRFARAADDIADHATLSPEQKLAALDRFADSLTGRGAADSEAEPLRIALEEKGLSARHPLDLVAAFRLDVTKLRYANWAELMDYCRLSAMPVGRFVLDVHGESQSTWRGSDPLCAALQILNHLQDCAADYRNLDRVYLPEDTLAAHGATVEMLAGERATPALLGAIRALARQTEALLAEAAPFSATVANTRLGLEIAAIQTLAERLVRALRMRDPLCERVHLGKGAAALVGAIGIFRGLLARLPSARASNRNVAT